MYTADWLLWKLLYQQEYTADRRHGVFDIAPKDHNTPVFLPFLISNSLPINR